MTQALAVVQQFVGAPDADLRKRGAHALASLGSDEAAAPLVQLMLNDCDPEVRAYAERQLVDLPVAERTALDKTVDRLLATETREVYALLGRLRLAGACMHIAPVPWSLRVRRAFTLGDHVRRKLSVRSWLLRGLRPAFVGWAFAALLFNAAPDILRLTPRDSSEVLALTIFGFLLCPVVALLALWHTPPLLHFDRTAGAVVDASVAGLMAFVATALLIIVYATLVDSVVDANAYAMMVAVPVMVMSVRLTTIVVGGAVRVPFVGFLFTVLTGWLAGVVASGLVVAFLNSTVDPIRLRSMHAWSVLCFSGLCAAWMFVALDRPGWNVLRRWELLPKALWALLLEQPHAPRRLRAVSAGAVWVTALVLVALAAPPAIHDGGTLAQVGAINVVDRVPVEFTIDAAALRPPNRDLRLELRRGPGDRRDYRMEGATHDSRSPFGAASVLADKLPGDWNTLTILDRSDEVAVATIPPEASAYRMRIVRAREAGAPIQTLLTRIRQRLGMRPSGADLTVTVTERERTRVALPPP